MATQHKGEMQMGNETQANKNSRAKYVGLGVALGAGIGTAMGSATGHLAVWLSVGIAIGVAIGSGFSRRRGGTQAS